VKSPRGGGWERGRSLLFYIFFLESVFCWPREMFWIFWGVSVFTVKDKRLERRRREAEEGDIIEMQMEMGRNVGRYVGCCIKGPSIKKKHSWGIVEG